MAKRLRPNRNGNGHAPDEMLLTLKAILDELRGLKEHVDLGLGHLGVRIERVENVLLETRRDLRELTGERLSERVARLEARLP